MGDELQLCLFDKQSSHMFWFNVLDGTSTWITSEQELPTAAISSEVTAVLGSAQIDEAESAAHVKSLDTMPKIVSRKQRRATVVLSGMERGKTMVRLRSMGSTVPASGEVSGSSSRSNSFVEGLDQSAEAAQQIRKEMDAIQDLAKTTLLEKTSSLAEVNEEKEEEVEEDTNTK